MAILKRDMTLTYTPGETDLYVTLNPDTELVRQGTKLRNLIVRYEMIAMGIYRYLIC